jgi:GDP-D-mannose 3',5'-epimerase
MSDLIVVAGAGGFIGGHLVADLLKNFYRVRAVDIKPLTEWWQVFPDAQNWPSVDLQVRENCWAVLDGAGRAFNLAADMGGIGFIESNKTACMLNVLVNTHLLSAAESCGVESYFFSSSACVYAAGAQDETASPALKESDAYPAMPEDGYGWEKLFSERMCRHFREDRGPVTTVARFHNVYGPHGTWRGGREKAPAAICRKVIEAKVSGSGEISIWGDGEQTRSFIWIDDCVVGIQKIAALGVGEPLNLGSSERVSINRLVSMVEEIAGVKLKRIYEPNAPKGVAGRNSDNTLIKAYLDWEPTTPLVVGLEKTYAWIYDQMRS